MLFFLDIPAQVFVTMIKEQDKAMSLSTSLTQHPWEVSPHAAT